MESRHKQKNSKKELGRFDIELIAIGKRTGLTFAEMNEFSVQDLLDYVHAYAGTEDDSPRMATQDDIDRFYS